MASPSKEGQILQLILENSPLKHWHFAEIVREAHVTKLVANKWLQKYVAQGLLLHLKEPGKFPYFTVGKDNAFYYSLKRVYALHQLHASGLLSYLLSLPHAKTIILFGSMIKGDWYHDSDIDIFVWGDTSSFRKQVYERKLHRTIEMHTFHQKKELQDVTSGLLGNVLNGYVLKGSIQDVLEVVHEIRY